MWPYRKLVFIVRKHEMKNVLRARTEAENAFRLDLRSKLVELVGA